MCDEAVVCAWEMCWRCAVSRLVGELHRGRRWFGFSLVWFGLVYFLLYFLSLVVVEAGRLPCPCGLCACCGLHLFAWFGVLRLRRTCAFASVDWRVSSARAAACSSGGRQVFGSFRRNFMVLAERPRRREWVITPRTRCGASRPPSAPRRAHTVRRNGQ